MKMLKFAIIGAGNFGKNYIRVIGGISGTELVAVTTQKKESLDILRDSLTSPAIATDDIHGVLENPDINCVIIATPPSTHFAIAKKAIENGKHVLLEKPMVSNLSQALGLQSELGKNTVTFMVGHQYVYNDYINFLKKQVINSKFGNQEKYYFGEHFYNGPVRNDASCLQDAGTHQLSIIQHIFAPGNLVGVDASYTSINGSKRDDFVRAELTFQNDLRAVFTLSWAVPEKTRRITIAGGKKIAVFNDVAKNEKLRIYEDGKKPSTPKIHEREPLANELRHFVSCIKRKKEPETGIAKSMQITQWLGEIEKAMKPGKL